MHLHPKRVLFEAREPELIIRRPKADEGLSVKFKESKPFESPFTKISPVIFLKKFLKYTRKETL